MEATKIIGCKETNRVRVCVNCRPILPTDISTTQDGSSHNDLVCSENSLPLERAIVINETEGRVMLSLEKSFRFDAAFDGHGRQDALYQHSVAPLVQHFVQDCDNASVMAYGQTGSGKTHTMMGSTQHHQSRGMIARAIEDIFTLSNPITDTISVSYFEIYNQRLYDLLCGKNTRTPLMLREENHRFQIPELGIHDVDNKDMALRCMREGNKFRSTANTGQNETSSRSHALFRIYLQRTAGGDTEHSSSKEAWLTLVDLAGSEAVGKIEDMGERLNEGKYINKGLLALGNCIADICHGRKHVPFRDSTLTKVLRESFQQGGLTGMIACISPAHKDVGESLKTLRYADRAKLLKRVVVPESAYKIERSDISRRRSSVAKLNSFPLNRKRGRYSCGSDFGSSSKRIKIGSTERLDNIAAPGHLNQTYVCSARRVDSTNAGDISTSERTEKNLSNIKEENKSLILNNHSHILISPKNSHTEKQPIEKITTPSFAFEDDESILQFQSPEAKYASDIPINSSSIGDSCPKAGLNKHLTNMATSEIASLSPIVKRISEQVGKQFEERVSRIEDQVHHFLNSGSKMTSIDEKILDEVVGDVKKMNTSEANKQVDNGNPNNAPQFMAQVEGKENMINQSNVSQPRNGMTSEVKDTEFKTKENISTETIQRNVLGDLEATNIKTPRRSMLRIQNYNTPGKYECTGAVTPNDARYTLRKGGYPLRKGRKSVASSLSKK